MVELAKKNAGNSPWCHAIEFQKKDITSLSSIGSATYSLTTLVNSAHHLTDLSVASAVVSEMDRMTAPHGLVLVMDLVRLRNAFITEWFVNTVGSRYLGQGLSTFYKDYRESMYAAWTTEEFQGLVPQSSRRVWVHLVPRGLPFMQFLMGLPVGPRDVSSSQRIDYKECGRTLTTHERATWYLSRVFLRHARKTVYFPRAPKEETGSGHVRAA